MLRLLIERDYRVIRILLSAYAGRGGGGYPRIYYSIVQLIGNEIEAEEYSIAPHCHSQRRFARARPSPTGRRRCSWVPTTRTESGSSQVYGVAGVAY